MSATSFKRSLFSSDPDRYVSFLVGNDAFVPSDFEHIETITVGAGGTSSVAFSSIPSTYKNLQIRATVINPNGSNGLYSFMRFNGDSGSNYTKHGTYAYISAGNPAIASSSAGAATTAITALGYFSGSTASTFPIASIIDLVQYSSASKYKTARILTGSDTNGGANTEVAFASGLWMSSSAISSISLLAYSQGFPSNFGQHSTFALYGVK